MVMDKFNYIANQQLPEKKVVKEKEVEIYIPRDRVMRQQWLEYYIKYDPIMNRWFSNKLIPDVGLIDPGITGILPIGCEVISALLAKCLESDIRRKENG